MYHYSVHGLSVSSTLPLPCLPSRTEHREPDVTIRLGEAPDELDNPVGKGVCYQASPGSFLLRLPGLGKCFVKDRGLIVLQPEESPETLFPYVFGSCFAVVAHLRSLVVLHAASVSKDGLTILFLGASGVGKSTLAAAFCQRGWTALSDDLTVVHPSDSGEAIIYPGPQRIRLNRRSSLALGFSESDAPESEYEGKTEFPLCGGSGPQKIDKIYLIGPWNKPEFGMSKQTNLNTVQALIVHTFRTRYLRGLNSREQHLQQVTRFSSSVELWGIKRPSFDFLLDELIERIESTF